MARKEKRNWLKALALATGAGMTLFGMILFGLYIGYQSDVHLGTAPWGVLVGSLTGGVVGLWSLIRQMIGK